MAKGGNKNAGMSFEEEDETTGDGGVGFEQGAEGDLVDFGNVEDDAGFELMPRGIYPCTITDIEFDTSEKGNKMWRVTLTVVEGDFANRKLFTFVVFSAKAMPMAKKSIRAFAPELLEKPFNPESVLEEVDLVGRRVDVKVAFDKYEGRKVNRVKELLPPQESGAGFLS